MPETLLDGDVVDADELVEPYDLSTSREPNSPWEAGYYVRKSPWTEPWGGYLITKAFRYFSLRWALTGILLIAIGIAALVVGSLVTSAYLPAAGFLLLGAGSSLTLYQITNVSFRRELDELRSRDQVRGQCHAFLLGIETALLTQHPQSHGARPNLLHIHRLLNTLGFTDETFFRIFALNSRDVVIGDPDSVSRFLGECLVALGNEYGIYDFFRSGFSTIRYADVVQRGGDWDDRSVFKMRQTVRYAWIYNNPVITRFALERLVSRAHSTTDLKEVVLMAFSIENSLEDWTRTS